MLEMCPCPLHVHSFRMGDAQADRRGWGRFGGGGEQKNRANESLLLVMRCLIYRLSRIVTRLCSRFAAAAPRAPRGTVARRWQQKKDQSPDPSSGLVNDTPKVSMTKMLAPLLYRTPVRFSSTIYWTLRFFSVGVSSRYSTSKYLLSTNNTPPPLLLVVVVVVVVVLYSFGLERMRRTSSE